MKTTEIVRLIKKRQEEERTIVGKIGANIKLKRKGKKRTLNHLSELSGVSISYLSKIENNLLKPNLDYLSNVLEDLEINEEFLAQSTIMNEWYLMTIKDFLNIRSYETELKTFVSERNDFQSNLIEFCMMIKENKLSNIPKLVKLLLQNINVMHTAEMHIFMLALCQYYIKTENHFSAGEILKQFNNEFEDASLLKLWYLELRHELALYQSSFTYYNNAVSELLKNYFLFNLEDKIKELKARSTAALAYFLEPDNFKDYLDDEEMYKSYRLSHVYFKRYENFESLEKKNDLAQLLIDELNGREDLVLKRWSKVEYREDPFELALKEYFKYKYDQNNANLFLQETLFAGTGSIQHHYVSLFVSERLMENYSSEHKYKQCYLVSERMRNLNESRRIYLKF